MTRVMVAMSLDRLLPGDGQPRLGSTPHAGQRPRHLLHRQPPRHLPVQQLLAGRRSGGQTTWASLTLGVTFACGYVFVGTALAGALLPFRAKALYDASPGSAYKFMGMPLVTIVGTLGAVAGAIFLYLFLTNDTLGSPATWPTRSSRASCCSRSAGTS